MASNEPTILALTANCGLAGIQEREFQSIFNKNPEADVVLISAQECHLEKTLNAFNSANNGDAQAHSQLMTTYTKWKARDGKTGMVTLALSRNGYSVEFDKEKRQELRRGRSSFSAFNKGGLYSVMTVKQNGNAVGTIHHTNYHLDSDNKKARARDLFNVYKNQFQTFATFDELAKATPDLGIAAGDANIRDRFIEGERNKIWQQAKLECCDDLILDALLVEGGSTYSLEDTYKTAGDKTKQGKRKGFIDGGALDRVTIRNNGSFSESTNTNGYLIARFSEDLIKDQKRDHLILGSSLKLVKSESDYERVKNSLCHRLHRLAPKLVTDLNKGVATTVDEDRLLGVHNFFFGGPKEGLIIQLMDPKLPESALAAKRAIIKELQTLTLENFEEKKTSINSQLSALKEGASKEVQSGRFGRVAQGLFVAALGAATLVTLSALSVITFGLFPLAVAAGACLVGAIGFAYGKHHSHVAAKETFGSIENPFSSFDDEQQDSNSQSSVTSNSYKVMNPILEESRYLAPRDKCEGESSLSPDTPPFPSEPEKKWTLADLEFGDEKEDEEEEIKLLRSNSSGSA